MEEIGNILRQARDEQNKSLTDISKETKIQETLLLALEEGDISAFAGEVYYKGALRNYAEAVGVDYQELRRLIEQQEHKSKDASTAKEDTGEEREKREKRSSAPIFRAKSPLITFNAFVWLVLFLFVAGGGDMVFYAKRSNPL